MPWCTSVSLVTLFGPVREKLLDSREDVVLEGFLIVGSMAIVADEQTR